MIQNFQRAFDYLPNIAIKSGIDRLGGVALGAVLAGGVAFYSPFSFGSTLIPSLLGGGISLYQGVEISNVLHVFKRCYADVRVFAKYPRIRGPWTDDLSPEKEIMVYGFHHCGIDTVQRVFRGKGYQTYNYEKIHPLEDKLHLQNDPYPLSTYRSCKKVLVYQVLDNWKTKKNVPIIFCVGAEDFASPTAEEICSKETKLNCRVTHKEIRRAYRLCYDPQVDEEIRKVAQKAFVFIVVDSENLWQNPNGSLTLISAPWEDPRWIKFFNKRKLQEKQNDTHVDWRSVLADEVARHRKEKSNE